MICTGKGSGSGRLRDGWASGVGPSGGLCRRRGFPNRRRARAGTRCWRPSTPTSAAGWEEGCHNARQLDEEIVAQGYPGAAGRVRQFLAHWRREHGRPGPIPCHQPPPPPTPIPPPVPSIRQATWILLRTAACLDERERAFLQALAQVCPEVLQVQALVHHFHDLLADGDLAGLDPWLHEVSASGIAELIGFATGLRRDRAAVEAAFTAQWSQGQTEGQVNRIKTLKRSMYRRAKFDLLRQRVLHPA